MTPNQVAHQRILNDKAPNRQRRSKINRCGQENTDYDDEFTIKDLQNSLKHLKNGKAAALDAILTEEIKNIGHIAMQWVLNLLFKTRAKDHIAYRDSGERKGPIEPEKLQTNFHFVSPLQIVRPPGTDPPVSHYRTFPYSRTGWLLPRQIVHCPGGGPHPAHRRWL